MKRTFEEINAKIQHGDAVVMTAEEAIKLAESKGIEKAAKEVDVVTTGTFGAMCSSGAFINFGHSEPPIRMKRVWLNDVPAYTGIAAVDAYIGATEEMEEYGHPYGGAHVIEDLVAGKAVHLRATAPGTDCYPRKDIDTYISLRTVNQALEWTWLPLMVTWSASIAEIPAPAQWWMWLPVMSTWWGDAPDLRFFSTDRQLVL